MNSSLTTSRRDRGPDDAIAEFMQSRNGGAGGKKWRVGNLGGGGGGRGVGFGE